jgi:flagellar biosynthesis chaperone FliJ
MIYLAFIIALALACAAGYQFFYLAFLQKVQRHDKRRIERLESELSRTRAELETVSRELEMAEQQLSEAHQEQDDVWPEIIDG